MTGRIDRISDLEYNAAAMTWMGERLTLARELRRLKKSELAKAIGVSHTLASRWESDKAPPNGVHRSELARVLGVSPSFFERARTVDVEVDRVSFRAHARRAVREVRSTAALVELACEVSDWLDDRFELPEPQVPSLPEHEPRLAAAMTREEWSLGLKRLSNVVHRLESKGIRFFSLPDGHEKTHAFAFWHHNRKLGVDRPIVFFDPSENGSRMRFSVLHELGHLVLHQDCKMGARVLEIQADQFASAFLIPRDLVIAHAPAIPTLRGVIAAKKTVGASAAAYVRSMRDNDLITESQYKSLCVQISRHGMNRHEPEPEPREVPSVYTPIAKQLRAAGHGLSSIARDLGVPLADVQQLVFVFGGGGQPSENRRQPNLRVVR